MPCQTVPLLLQDGDGGSACADLPVVLRVEPPPWTVNRVATMTFGKLAAAARPVSVVYE